MSEFTKYAVYSVIPWLLLSPFQYGYAIGELNQIHAAMACKGTGVGQYGRKLCVPMTDTSFGVVTSIFLGGGLIGSLMAPRIIDPRGRRAGVQLAAVGYFIGSLVLAVADSISLLIVGRLFKGLAAGLGLCVIPPFLAEISPPRVRGAVGVLNQFGVVTGILVTQTIGFFLSEPGWWRGVFLVTLGLSALQLLVGLYMIESPAWLTSNTRHNEARSVASLIWHGKFGDRDDEEALLRESASSTVSSGPPPASVLQCLRAPELRRPLLIVALSMLVQQVSGINAVMYYSTDILSAALPGAGAYVSLGVAVVNLLMTIPPIFMIERYGHRKLLIISIAGILTSLVVLGYGLNARWTMPSSIATLSFVSAFAMGMGPIPFVMIPEVSPLYAVSGLGSIALSVNWIINFFVGLGFLPLREWLTDEDGGGAGTVFFIFATVMGVTTAIFLRVYDAKTAAHTRVQTNPDL